MVKTTRFKPIETITFLILKLLLEFERISLHYIAMRNNSKNYKKNLFKHYFLTINIIVRYF
jgi:hypothetical protein